MFRGAALYWQKNRRHCEEAQSTRQSCGVATGVTSARRLETLPKLPTVTESGVPGYAAVGWFGLLAPVATPKNIVAKLSGDANRVLAQKDVREKMLALGSEAAGNTPEEFAAFIHED